MGHTIDSNVGRKNHGDADLFAQQGESLANLGHYSEALTAFDQAIAAHHSNPTKRAATWVFRAVVLLHLQVYDDALVSCDRALELEPRHVEAWVFRGVALNYLERYQDSYDSYAKAISLAHPEKTCGWRAFVSVLSRLGPEIRLGRFPSVSRIVCRFSAGSSRLSARLRSWWYRLKHLNFHH